MVFASREEGQELVLPVKAHHKGWVFNTGQVPYDKALALQDSIREMRVAGKIPDTLILLEHPPVITLGRSGNMENILVPSETLAALGVSLSPTSRGGDVTYHGPGQLVGYPILDLSGYGQDVHSYLRAVEEVLIQALADFGIRAGRVAGLTGVWVDNKKIAAIGIHIRRWVTMHGFALNVNPNLSHFSLIHPCGIKDRPVTSMAQLLSHDVDMNLVRESVIHSFSRVFGIEMEEKDPDTREEFTASQTSI
ncbi:MAG: lipoyl(octanoyl) transferase LipB [Chloroflexi bacterium]|nr:lipoyl(octanoyl) transferase LipB [Chloroflexota bacterium]